MHVCFLRDPEHAVFGMNEQHGVLVEPWHRCQTFSIRWGMIRWCCGSELLGKSWVDAMTAAAARAWLAGIAALALRFVLDIACLAVINTPSKCSAA